MPATRTRDDLILGFDQMDASMLASVGGKAANLGELTRAGLPVPPGLCVTTAAYELVAAPPSTRCSTRSPPPRPTTCAP